MLRTCATSTTPATDVLEQVQVFASKDSRKKRFQKAYMGNAPFAIDACATQRLNGGWSLRCFPAYNLLRPPFISRVGHAFLSSSHVQKRVYQRRKEPCGTEVEQRRVSTRLTRRDNAQNNNWKPDYAACDVEEEKQDGQTL